jgi:anthranilate phosphoribosyltransferase
MRDIAALNAAAGLVIAEKAGDLGEGLRIANEAIDSGKARQTLEALIGASRNV